MGQGGGCRVRRTRTAASLAAVVTVSMMLAGCATATTPAGDVVDHDLLAERAGAVGIAPELVFTIDAGGYDLAPQSVGTAGGDGMSATWFDSGTGAMLTIRTDHGTVTAESCAAMSFWNGTDETATCTEEADGGVWRREGGGLVEYLVQRPDAQVRVIGNDETPDADLRRAATSVRAPSEAELELMFSDLPSEPAVPVERGDLPEHGDGAPVDPPGAGG